MIWMRTILRIIVRHSICKRVRLVTGAASSAVDMKAEDRTFTRISRIWQTENLGYYHNAHICLIKVYVSKNIWIGRTALYRDMSCRAFSRHGNAVYTVVIARIHNYIGWIYSFYL